MTDLFDLTLMTMREIAAGVLKEGYATGGAAGTLIDTNDRTETEDDYWKTGTVWVIETTDGLAPQGELSVISGFTAATSTVALRNAFSVPVDAGDRYAIGKRKYPLELLTQMVNRALRENIGKYLIIDKTLTTVDSQTLYTLPSGSARGLRKVKIYTNSDAADPQPQDVLNWRIIWGGIGASDVLALPASYDGGYTIELTYLGLHPYLYSAADELSPTIDPGRVSLWAAIHCIRDYQDKVGEQDYQDTLNRLEQRVQTLDNGATIVAPPIAPKGVTIIYDS